jgi:molybdopterin converting factor small subunit
MPAPSSSIAGYKPSPAKPLPVQIECAFFGPLRDPVGEKTVYRELDAGATVGDLLADLECVYDGLDLLEDGDRREHLTISVEGKDVRHLDGIDTELADGTLVRLTTAVYGG